MESEWILDVLADLRTFAQSNGMAGLAEQLDDTAIVAMAEIAATGEGQDVNRSEGVSGTDGTDFARVGIR